MSIKNRFIFLALAFAMIATGPSDLLAQTFDYSLIVESNHIVGEGFEAESALLGETHTEVFPFSIDLPEGVEKGVAIVRTGMDKWQKFIALFEQVNVVDEAGNSKRFIKLTQDFDTIFLEVLKNHGVFEFSYNEDVYEMEKIGTSELLFPMAIRSQSDCEEHVHCNNLNSEPMAWTRPINGTVKYASSRDQYWLVQMILKPSSQGF